MPRVVGLVLAAVLLSALPLCAGDGVVAITTADPSCPDQSGSRFVDCGNGTVTDNETGLVWLKDATCYDMLIPWFNAMATAQGLSTGHCGLSDNSLPGDWRLPSRDEWADMIADAAALGCMPSITNDAGDACWVSGDPGSSFVGVIGTFFWASSTDSANVDVAVVANLFLGDPDQDDAKAGSGGAMWPVRYGQ